ncbi:MAG: AAA family ATPase [Thermodesulfobacteriota bacterium]
MRYGIVENRGFLLLTGDVGTGKTTLINALLDGLGDEVIAAFVPDPGLSGMDFFNYIAGAFGIKKRFASKGDFLFYFRHFLDQANQANKKVLLIIDESQRLNHELLEEIRLLSNIEKQNTKLINIFFVGQNEFNDLLWEPRNRALRQRITVNYNVYALTEEEIGEYIRHRLRVAGTDKKIFTSEAVRGIMQFSEGFPRMINIICDHALLTGFVKGVTLIGPGIIRECAEDLQIPRSTKQTDEKRKTPDEPTRAVVPAIPEVTTEDTDNNQHSGQVRRGYGIPIAAFCFMAVCAAAVYFLSQNTAYRDDLEKYWRALLGTNHRWSGKELDGSKRPEEMDASRRDDRPENVPLINSETQPQGLAGEITSNEDAVAPHGVVASPAGAFPAMQTTPDGSVHNGGIHSADIPDRNLEKMTEAEAHVPARPIATTGSSIQEGSISFARETTTPVGVKPAQPKKIIYFNHNSNELPDAERKALDRMAAVLKGDASRKLKIVGYTDSSGVYSYNKSLSLFRANIIKSYLVGKGVHPDSMVVSGMGPENPTGSNATAAGRKFNRRVEIEFIDAGQ